MWFSWFSCLSVVGLVNWCGFWVLGFGCYAGLWFAACGGFEVFRAPECALFVGGWYNIRFVALDVEFTVAGLVVPLGLILVVG